MIYYYFPTKDDLFLAVVEEVYVALLADLEARLARSRPVEERIRRLYAASARSATRDAGRPAGHSRGARLAGPPRAA